MKPGSPVFITTLKALVWVGCLTPLGLALLAAFNLYGFELGANPIEELLHSMGKWGLKFLLISLAITPVRRWTGWHWLIRFRRLFGLFAYFYVVLHLTVYLVLDQSLLMSAVIEDIVKRPYITLGMLAVILLTPLALTSTRGMMRRLGKRWAKLHRLVYVAAVLGVSHFYWQVKLDTLEAGVYIIILTILLGARWLNRSQAGKSA